MALVSIPATLQLDWPPSSVAPVPVVPPGPTGPPVAVGSAAHPPVVVRTWTNWANGIPITMGVTGYTWYTEYGMSMPKRNPGDVIIVNALAEVTNPYPFNVQCDRYIGYGVPGATQNMVTALTPVRGENITPDMHHMTIDVSGVIDDQLLKHVGLPLTLPAGWVLSLIMEAASTAATPGQGLINEGPGYGELVAVIFPAS